MADGCPIDAVTLLKWLMMKIPDLVIEKISTDTRHYLEWLRTIEPTIEEGFFLAGPYLSPPYPVWPRAHDNFHYPLGMKKLLGLGFAGIKSAALTNADKFEGNQRQYLLLISDVYDAIIKVVERFADAAKEKGLMAIEETCRAVIERPPESFLEACQVYWFSVVFRVGTATIGRIDQHLFPFYENDIQDGSMDGETGRRIIDELLMRFEKRGRGLGDTLQNITLGGSDAFDNDETNDLTYLILEEFLKTKHIEPKINIRLHKKSSDRLMNLVSELQLNGTGICTVFNDEAIIEGLKDYGRPDAIAANYCADGCTEIILDGMGETWFRYVDCVKAVEHTLLNGEENQEKERRLKYYSDHQDAIDIKPPVARGLRTGEFKDMGRFEDFYGAYLRQIEYQVHTVLKKPYNSDEYPMRLFTAATLPNVIETASEPYMNPECYHTYGLFIGSLGTAVNSLASIKSLVYQEKSVEKPELLEALRGNFENHLSLQQKCKDAPKFGNDDDFVDGIAVDIAARFRNWVTEYKDRTERSILPGLYNHLFHHTAYYVGATPDGRRRGDSVGEHLSPTPGTAHKGPTAILNSVAKVNTQEQIFGSTLHLNLPRVSLEGAENPQDLLACITRAFCNKQGCVLNINVLDAETLLDAQKHPEKYEDLIVRVWGFSYYFTKLSKEMQAHVISRSISA